MADLNALIAQGTQFQAPVNPFVQYAQMQQLQQGEQANQLNQMKMQEYQRGMEETNAMRRLDPNSPSYLADITRINPEKGFALGKMRQEAKTAGTEGQIKDTKLIADKLALLPDAYRMADTPEAYLALHQSVHADPVLGPYLKSLGATPEKGMATLQNAVQTGKFNELRMGSMQSVSQLLDSMKPLTVAAGSSVYNPQAGTFTQAPRSEQLKTPAEEAQAIRLAQAGRAPAQPRPEQPPVAVVDPVTGKQVFVSREEALRGRMTPAASMEGLAPREIQKRESVLPQATSAVKGFEAKSDSFVKDLTALRDHPGLNQITGLVAGRVPAVTGAGRAAQALYDKVIAKGGFQALQDLRDASKTGGALGNVSNQEGKQLASSFAAINRTQDANDMKAALDQAIADVQGSRTRIREAYDQTYSYKSGGSPSSGASGGVDSSNPLLR
jgi:hypothetical protein